MTREINPVSSVDNCIRQRHRYRRFGQAAKAYWDFIQGYGSIKRGDEEGASRSLIQLAQYNARTGADTHPANAILELELKAMLKLAQGTSDEAIAMMHSATAREDAMPFNFGPPPVVKPSHELLGEMLLQLKQPRDAGVEFQRALFACFEKDALSARPPQSCQGEWRFSDREEN